MRNMYPLAAVVFSISSLQHPWKVILTLTLTGSHSTNLGAFLLLSALSTHVFLTHLSLIMSPFDSSNQSVSFDAIKRF